MSDAKEKPAAEKAPDRSGLARFGYAEELRRAMGGFSSFAVSFSIISVLTGIVTTYTDAISAGGPAALGIGWPLVCVGTIIVALAMAELASAFPTAGALYHWSALLGGPGWGWFTAMTNLIGQFAIVAAIDLGCARELAATLGMEATTVPWLYMILLASHAIVNIGSVRLVALLNDFSATVHVLGVAVLAILLFAHGASRPVSYLAETGFTTRPDGIYAIGFCNALILGMFTFTGYDASAHLAEETHDPARKTPRGILTSVIVSAVAGYILIIALTLHIPSLADTAKDDHAALFILRTALGAGAGRWAMGLAICAMWFCGLSSVTSASRTLFAFARDGGLPFASRIRTVGAWTKTPHVAIAIATIAPFLLVIFTMRLSDRVFLAMVSMSTMALYVSYTTPIGLGAVARMQGRWKKRGPWSLGRWGVPIAWCAVVWTCFVLISCSLPPNLLPAEMLAAMLVVLAGVFVVLVHGKFRGPTVDLAALEADAK